MLGVTVCASAFDPTAGDYSREWPSDIRVLSYNVEGQLVSGTSTIQARFGRIINALDPDVIVFQEIADTLTANQVAAQVMTLTGESGWTAHMGIGFGVRTVVASRFPLADTRTDTFPASSTRGVTIARINLPDGTYDRDLYIMGVHLKCCNSVGNEDENRQRSADAIAAWMGDARRAGGFYTLPNNTPMVVVGDFNLVGGPQPEQTLLTGNIQSESTYGPDVKGDWDNSNITDLTPADPFTGTINTWPSTSAQQTSRLDRFLYTDSAVEIGARGIVNPATMTSAVRTALGVQSTDASAAADHLPIFADFRMGPAPSAGSLWTIR